MDKESNPYLDFSSNDWIVSAFDPNAATSNAMTLFATEIQKYLVLENPVLAIKGLVALQSATVAVVSASVSKGFRRITTLLTIIAALIGYIAYLLTGL